MVSTNSIYTSICGAATIYKVARYQNICYSCTSRAINILNCKEKPVRRHTRSLLEELNDIAVKKDTEAVIESRAAHVIDSAVNLLQLIRENFDPESAYELERRFLNSIKAGDPAKFTRGIRKLRDNKETAKGLKLIEGDIKDDE